MQMSRPTRTVAPAGELVSIETVAAHLSVDFNDDDVLLQSFIDAAIQHLDGHSGILGRCLLTQQWQVRLTDWAGSLLLPFPDVTAAVITYQDDQDAEVTVPDSAYDLIEVAEGTELVFDPDFSDPSLSEANSAPISVTMTAGFGASESIPEPIKVAVMLIAAHWYDNPEAVGNGQELPFGATALLAPFRRMSV